MKEFYEKRARIQRLTDEILELIDDHYYRIHEEERNEIIAKIIEEEILNETDL